MLSAERARAALVFSPALCAAADKLPSNVGRSTRVHALLAAFGLLRSVVAPARATADEIKVFHDSAYVDFLLKAERDDADDDDAAVFGLEDDCPVFPGLAEYCQLVAGGALTAARALSEGNGVRAAVFLDGGRHHALCDQASGFCYVNDAVLAIMELRKHAAFQRVLYVDVDVHHGDGVERAFLFSDAVMTVSLHQRAPGFFPGTGSREETGRGKGKGYAVNVPLCSGCSSATLERVFREVVVDCCARAFRPQCIVVQCGCDGMSGDDVVRGSNLGWNVGMTSYARCVEMVLQLGVPVLVLGGGGYNHCNAARCWTFLVGTVARFFDPQLAELPAVIPDHAFSTEYARGGYELLVEPGCQIDENDAGYIDELIKGVREQVSGAAL